MPGGWRTPRSHPLLIWSRGRLRRDRLEPRNGARPAYPRVAVRAGAAAVVALTCSAPEGMLVLAAGSPGWVTLDPDCTLTLAPPAELREDVSVTTVQTRTPSGSLRRAVVEVDVEGAATQEAEQNDVDSWCEVAPWPDLPCGVALVTVKVGKPLPAGARVETARDGSRVRCAPVAAEALSVSSPRLRSSVRVRVVSADGSTDSADAG